MERANNIIQNVSNPSFGSGGAMIAFTAAADILILAPWDPIQIVRWGIVATSTINDANNPLILTCDLRVTAGSDVGRIVGATTAIQAQTGYNANNQPQIFTDTAGGTLTLTKGASQLAAGKGAYHTMNPQSGSGTPNLFPQPDTAFTSPGGVNVQFEVYPGQELVIAVAGPAPASGAGRVFVEYVQRGFQGTGFNDSVMAQIVPANISPTPSNAIVNMTRKYS